MRGLALVAVLAVSLAGCAGLVGQSSTTVTHTQVVVQTVTAAPTPSGPATYLKVGTVDNRYSGSLEIRLQAYSLDADGDRVTSGYAIKSIRANQGTTTLSSADYPKCNDRMEGIYVQLFQGGEELTQRQYWHGIHCQGEDKSYTLKVFPDLTMSLG